MVSIIQSYNVADSPQFQKSRLMLQVLDQEDQADKQEYSAVLPIEA